MGCGEWHRQGQVATDSTVACATFLAVIAGLRHVQTTSHLELKVKRRIQLSCCTNMHGFNVATSCMLATCLVSILQSS